MKAFKPSRQVVSSSYELVKTGAGHDAHSASPLVTRPARSVPRLSLLEALGPYCTWTYAVGYAAISGSLSFLLFLWTGNGDNFVWQQIALAGWMTRCVSLTSTILRVAISIQAASATSILAAILLQEYRVHLLHAPAISFIRWENSGPLALVRFLWPRFEGPHTVWLWLTILTLTTTTIVSQVSSTLLLTDINQSSTLSSQNVSRLPSDLNETIFSSYTTLRVIQASYWLEKPNVFPTFAEYHEVNQTQDPGFYDTGPTLRGFLPIANESQRSELQSFRGYSAILDARVVCMKPKLRFSTSLWGQNGAIGLLGNPPAYIQLIGTAGVEPIKNNYYQNYAQSIGFNCSAPLGINAIAGGPQSSEWQLSLCSPGNGGTDGTEGIQLDQLYDGQNFYVTPFLVFNTSGDVEAWYAASIYPSWTEQASGDNADSEWATFSSNLTNRTIGLDPPILGVSLCFTPLSSISMPVIASGGIPHTEPSLSWNLSTSRYNTQSIRFSLGATEPAGTISQRGLLNLETTVSQEQWSYSQPAFITDFAGGSVLSGIDVTNKTTLFCSTCAVDDSDSTNTTSFVHPVLSAIFTDIVQSTGHPGLALQAILTVVCGGAYADLSSLFTIAASATVAEYVKVQAPTQWLGLPIVMAISTVHCVVVTGILVVFARSEKRSIIGSAWSALGQLVQGPALREWVHDASLIDDETMEDRMRAVDAEARLVGISFADGSDAVHLRLRK